MIAVYLITVVLSGLVYWLTRKTEIPTNGILLLATSTMFVPVVNLLCACFLAYPWISGWLGKELSWYTGPKKI